MPEIVRRRPELGTAPDARELRKAHNRLTRGSIPDRYAAFVRGEITVDDLDDEEVYRGQLRNSAGDFRGGVPKFVPREFATALQAEARRRFSADMNAKVPEALNAVSRMLGKKSAQPGDGAIVNAAFKTIERFAGRVPENVNMHVNVTKFEDIAEAVIVSEVIIDAVPDDDQR